MLCAKTTTDPAHEILYIRPWKVLYEVKFDPPLEILATPMRILSYHTPLAT